jgi:hypothetical protein
MKKSYLFLLLLLPAIVAAQKTTKIKGSRNVTVEQKEIAAFEAIEVEDNLEVFLVKGDRCELEIQADDNIHDAISISENGGTLRLSVGKEVTGVKQMAVKITYTDDFKMLLAKDDSSITALTDMKMGNFTFKSTGSAKIFATIKAKTFTLMANDKSKTELNLTAETSTIELSKNSQLKALISAQKLKFDMYQKSTAAIEGDVIDLKLRLDSTTNFTGKNLTAKDAELVAEGFASIGVAVTGIAIIDISGKSEIDLYGDQNKIEIRKFSGTSAIRKKPLKA